MVTHIFRTLAAIFSLYNLLCFIRIILTWVPQVSYSKPAQILAKICDPWLNLFRGIRWLKFGNLDFSPALALCILSAVGSLFQSFSNRGKISVGFILASALQIIWSFASSLILFFTILLLIRFIIILVKKSIYSGNPVIEQIDRSISPVVYKIAKTFSFGHTPEYKKSLLLSIIVLVLIQLAGSILFGFIMNLLAGLPF